MLNIKMMPIGSNAVWQWRLMEQDKRDWEGHQRFFLGGTVSSRIWRVWVWSRKMLSVGIDITTAATFSFCIIGLFFSEPSSPGKLSRLGRIPRRSPKDEHLGIAGAIFFYWLYPTCHPTNNTCESTEGIDGEGNSRSNWLIQVHLESDR